MKVADATENLARPQARGSGGHGACWEQHGQLKPARLDILYVITDLDVGGVPLHLYRLVKAMRRRGYSCAVVSLGGAGAVGERLCDDGVDVLSCEGRGGWDFRVIGRLARIIETRRPALVHSLLFHANVAARLAARQTGLPRDRVICEIQTVELERRWHLLVDRLTYLDCRYTIGNSPSVIEHLAVRAGIPRDRLRLVRGGIDPEVIQSARPVDRSSLGIDVDAPIVLWVGRLDRVKGLACLVEAFGTVADCTPAHLCLVGDGPLRQELLEQIAQSELTTRVHLLGARDDVPGLLRAADVFAFVSRTEGLPNSLMEAMAAGCPIVTTDVPGCRDLIRDGETGLLVPFGDVGALAHAVLCLLRERELAMQLGYRAAAAVARHWHLAGTHAAYAEIYASIIRAG